MKLPNRLSGSSRQAAYESIVGRASSCLPQIFEEARPVSELARRIGASSATMERAFKEVSGITPKQFLAAIRLRRAKEILHKTEHSITDICLQLGYGSIGSFTRMFISAVGVSPSAFRAAGRRFGPCPFARVVQKMFEIGAGARRANTIGLSGSIVSPPRFYGILIVSVSDSPLRHGRPFSRTVVNHLDPVRLKVPRKGVYHILATGVSAQATYTRHLLSDANSTLFACDFLHVEANMTNAFRLCLRPIRQVDCPLLAIVACEGIGAGNRSGKELMNELSF